MRYLETRPDRATLQRILDAIPDPPADLVRKDKRFGELGLDPADYVTKKAVIDLLADKVGRQLKKHLEKITAKKERAPSTGAVLAASEEI